MREIQSLIFIRKHFSPYCKLSITIKSMTNVPPTHDIILIRKTYVILFSNLCAMYKALFCYKKYKFRCTFDFSFL